MKKKTIGIRRVNVIYREDGVLKERIFEFSKSMSYAECTKSILEEMDGVKVEAMKTTDLGIRKYEVETLRKKWLEEKKDEQDNCNRQSDTGWGNWTVQ